MTVYNFEVFEPLTTKFIMDKIRMCWQMESGSGTVRMQCNLGYLLARIPLDENDTIETRYFYSSANTSIFHSPTVEISGSRSLNRLKNSIDRLQPIEEKLANQYETSQWTLLAIVNLQMIFYRSSKRKRRKRR